MKVLFVCLIFLVLGCSASLSGEEEDFEQIAEDFNDDAIAEQNDGSDDPLDAQNDDNEIDEANEIKYNEDNGQDGNVETTTKKNIEAKVEPDNDSDKQDKLNVWGKPSDVLTIYWKNFILNQLREKEKQLEAARDERLKNSPCGPISCVISCMESNQHTGYCRGKDCVCY